MEHVKSENVKLSNALKTTNDCIFQKASMAYRITTLLEGGGSSCNITGGSPQKPSKTKEIASKTPFL